VSEIAELGKTLVITSKRYKPYLDYAMTSRDFIDLYIFLRYYGFEDKSPFKEELALAQEAAELRSIGASAR